VGARQTYVAALLSHFGSAVLEYDVEGYNHITFLLELDKFYTTVHLRFVEGAPFPDRMPIVTLSSPYKLQGSELTSMTFNEYVAPPPFVNSGYVPLCSVVFNFVTISLL
jgi:BRCA1-A complex subunit BRE